MSNLKDVIADTGFRFNKALGQNFISDKNLLDAIVADSGVTQDDVVVEIGTGGGTLTRALADVAKRVTSFEVDENLKSVLALTLQGVDNVEVVFCDVLKTSDDALREIVGADSFKVVANLPYYITTPLVMRFLESDLDVKSLTVMVQQEVADRFVAKANTADYSAITLAIESRGYAAITRKVNRKMFYPVPNVDSAVVRIDVDRKKLAGENRELLHKLIRSSFAMRRKTLVNNLSAAFGIDKQTATEKIVSVGFSPMVRGEALSLEDYIKLSHVF
ncbi:MAG: 16S rRNA (adenine(1518)-N(6)/adenine(1519)-N(6))-dimethyltransferase RsmA [Bacteroides sp.]|nr:16S rRNA (adenine(1518)-N(6)/adenine(1519)-N(6))-dimethyltransferase RsmA [Bacillota bacterium]MCM1393393.1 16S rRNA (adenine(1518)-N(6)/adenine(1519)-N(6))-dimethyltransferase RsmA [[Eubacterium] siraeum]MCM1455541.1 16S rRNA (adenine(1518)-N(6)/adenine(1519)-N(6))-dimethyltransferase RsmA [Bacteroides sp.]